MKPLLTWDDFSKGLWLLGPKDGNPAGTLRRAKGLHPVRGQSLRSRDGHAVINALGVTGNINSHIYFNSFHWVGTDAGNLYRIDSADSATLIQDGFDGTPLRFLLAPPAGGLPDWLFVSGGGPNVGLIKVSPDGQVKPWGIEAPLDGFKVEALPARSKTITTFTEFNNNPAGGDDPSLEVWAPVEIPRGGEAEVSSPDPLDAGYDATALRVTSKPSRLAWIRRRILTAPKDLTLFDATQYDKFTGSSDLDYICLRVWVDLPNFIDFIEIALDLGVAGFANRFTTDFYTALVSVQPKTGFTTEQANIKSLSELLVEKTEQIPLANRVQGVKGLNVGKATINTRRVAVRGSKGEAEILPFFAPTQIELAAQAWTDIRIAKASFHRSGVDETKDFSNITAVAIYFHTRRVDPETGENLGNNDIVTVLFKDFRMEGGYGVKGPTYFDQITYRDSETGNRSNPNPTPVATPQATTGKPIDSIDRNPFLLSKLPFAEQAGADEIEQWRTLGDGSDLFLAQRVKIVDLATARDFGLNAGELFDGVADIYDFNRREPVTGIGTVTSNIGDQTILNFSDVDQARAVQVGDELTMQEEKYTVVGKPVEIQVKLDRPFIFPVASVFEWLGGLSELGAIDPIALPLDNIVPEPDFDDVILCAGRAWWISKLEGQRGRIFFSPRGRPESLEDFRDIANDQEETQRLIEWNDIIWVWTQAGIYAVEPQGDPIPTPKKVAQAPGTTQPDTVVKTSKGVFYQASEGIRVFDGTDSVAVDEGLRPIFKGEAVEGIAAFEGVYASQDEAEYIISDGTTTIAFDLTNGRWREIGGALAALSYVPELRIAVASRGSTLVEVEQEGASDDVGAAIPLAWELPSVPVANGERALVRRVLLDLDTFGQRLTPTLIIDNVEVLLPPIQTGTPTVRRREKVELAVSREIQQLGLRLTGEVTRRVEVFDVEVDGRVLGGVG